MQEIDSYRQYQISLRALKSISVEIWGGNDDIAVVVVVFFVGFAAAAAAVHALHPCFFQNHHRRCPTIPS
jgi:hypothetical protein